MIRVQDKEYLLVMVFYGNIHKWLSPPPTKRSDLCSMAVSKRDDEASTMAAVPHICQKVKAVITPSSIATDLSS